MLELNIESRDYDFLGMAGEIEAWCGKNQIAPRLTNRIHLLFEELMELMLPVLKVPRIQAVCEYSAQTERAEWTISYGGPRYDPVALGDELIRSLLSGMAEKEEYTWDENAELPNRLSLVVKRG